LQNGQNEKFRNGGESMNGKGDKRRPQQVDQKTFESNWDKIFNKDNKDLQYESDNPLERPYSPSQKREDEETE